MKALPLIIFFALFLAVGFLWHFLPELRAGARSCLRSRNAASIGAKSARPKLFTQGESGSAVNAPMDDLDIDESDPIPDAEYDALLDRFCAAVEAADPTA